MNLEDAVYSAVQAQKVAPYKLVQRFKPVRSMCAFDDRVDVETGKPGGWRPVMSVQDANAHWRKLYGNDPAKWPPRNRAERRRAAAKGRK